MVYNVELQYAANDNSTVFKIFAADYISSDNSGGKVFVSKHLDPNESAVKTSFVLDQQVDSLFIVLETKDEKVQIGRVNIRTEEYVYNDTLLLYAIMIVFTAVLLYLANSDNARIKGFELDNNRPFFTCHWFLAIS